ncbi:unnamed protein product, partial [Polarella glacialis]
MSVRRLSELRGLGGKLGERLRGALGLEPEALCSDLLKVPLAELQRQLGEQQGAFVHRLCRGEDSEEVKAGAMKRNSFLSFKSLLPPAESLAQLEPWLSSLSAELAERLAEDPERRPRTLVLHHRGRTGTDHVKHWMAGRTSEFTKTVTRSCAFPTGASGGRQPPAVTLAAAARKILLERISAPFPCSRLAIGATDFVEVSSRGITAFFAGRPTATATTAPEAGCKELSHHEPLEMEELTVDDDAQLTEEEIDSESMEDAGCTHPAAADPLAQQQQQQEQRQQQQQQQQQLQLQQLQLQQQQELQLQQEQQQQQQQQQPQQQQQHQQQQQQPAAASEVAASGTSSAAAPAPPKAQESMPAGGVAEFHRCSRLHFLGTWRERFDRWRDEGGQGVGLVDPEVLADLQQEMQALRSQDAPSLWAHLDMDCFFASVATRDDSTVETDVPAAVVTGMVGSSEICSANYAARRLGVNTDLWCVERALAVLPSLRLLPITGQLLRSVEATWQNVYQLLVVACDSQPERVLMRSCDESALLVEGVSDPTAWAQALRKAVRRQTKGCTCSVGLGPSQVVAKLATKACKPDGARRIRDAEVQEFLMDMPLSAMPQVGRSMASKLQERGLEICRDLVALEKFQLRQWFGVKGETLWLNSRGLDSEAALQHQTQRKTMSAEMNWGIRPQDRPAALKVLSEVAQQLAEQLAGGSFRASQLTLKLKIAVPGWVESKLMKKGGHGECDDISRSSALPSPTSDSPSLFRCAQKLFDSISPDPVRIRGVGLAARLSTGDTAASPSTGSSKQQPGGGGLGRWLRKAPSAPLSQEPMPMPSAPEVVAVELSDSDAEERGGASEVACPVCGQLQPAATAEAHVNSHFDGGHSVTLPPAKRPRSSGANGHQALDPQQQRQDARLSTQIRAAASVNLSF